MASMPSFATSGNPGGLQPKFFWRLAKRSEIRCKFGGICVPNLSLFWAYLYFRTAPYMKFVSVILAKLPQWREERLPPPRVNQSEVTLPPFSIVPNGIWQLNLLSMINLAWLVNQAITCGLSVLTVLLVLHWIWISTHLALSSLTPLQWCGCSCRRKFQLLIFPQAWDPSNVRVER